MLPLCEDTGLAASKLRPEDLLSLSATCGVGVDTVPLGMVGLEAERLAALYLDAAALAERKQRPLSVRVFPVPGLREGELTAFTGGPAAHLCDAECRGL